MLADLEIDKSGAPDPVKAGEMLTYTLNLSNLGPSIAENVVITDSLPSNVTFDSVISQPPSLSGPIQTGQTLTWTTRHGQQEKMEPLSIQFWWIKMRLIR